MRHVESPQGTISDPDAKVASRSDLETTLPSESVEANVASRLLMVSCRLASVRS